MVDHHLGLDGNRAFVGFGVDHGERDLGHAQRLALARAGEDHVLHVRAAQGLGALLTQDPTDPVEDVGLAAPIWSHHDGDAGSRHGELRAIAEAFEAEDVDLFQFQHVSLRDARGFEAAVAARSTAFVRGRPISSLSFDYRL